MRKAHYRLLTILVMAVLGASCTFRPRSSYHESYRAHLTDFRTPTVESILEADSPASRPWHKDFDQPIDEVWRACVEVGTQFWGILDLAWEADGTRRMAVVAAGRPRPVGRGFTVAVDRWLAVAVEPLGPGSTRLTLAWINPVGSRVTRNLDLALDRGKLKRSAAVQQFIALSLADRFLHDVEAALVPEAVYLERFPFALPRRPARGARPAEQPGKQPPKRPGLIREWGHLDSAAIRRNHIVLSYPELEARLGEIVNQLYRATGPGPRVRNIYILSLRNDNALITPNGDLFLTRGLLDKAESIDQLAGVIAHELAHLYQGDHFYRQKRFQRTRRTAGILGSVAAVGGFLASGIYEPPPEPTHSRPISEQLLTTEEILTTSAVAVVGGLLLPQLISTERLKMGDDLAGEYTQAQEMRADELATEYLWYAGYQHDGLLRYLAGKGLGSGTKR